MRIAFATTLGKNGSTIIGRVVPLAAELAKKHEVHVLLLEDKASLPPLARLVFHSVGHEPFTRTTEGKKRLTGLSLISSLLSSAWNTAQTLQKIKPDRVIIVKTLPHNVLGVWLWRLFNRKGKIVLDVDDFELTANKLTSLLQRASIHWAERKAAQLASAISAASPFLVDRFQNFAPIKKVILLLTGLSPELIASLPQPSRTPNKTLLYLGSLSISSGHRIDLLPEIVEKSQCTLIMAGTGDDEKNLRSEFEKRHISHLVEWHGRFTHADIPSLLKQSAILIDPIDASIAQRAKSSFRVMLAMSSGWPVVTSNVGFRPDVIPHKWHSLFFAEPNDAASYAQKIQEIFKNYPSLEPHQWSWVDLAKQLETIL